MEPIVLATGNPHKVEELRAIFAAAGVGVVGLKDLGGQFEEPHEHGKTFEENASIKALSYARQTGRVCLADDSGLEIDALGGRPGVISSHYASDGRETGASRAERDAANNARVLRELEGVPIAKRAARFVCVMVVARPEGRYAEDAETNGRKARVLAVARGTLEGRIGIPPRVPRGENGFGYDPLFLVAPEFAQTGAELATTAKNRLSHRAKAAAKMAEQLRAGL